MKNTYLDHAATTPCDPFVVAAMMPYFSEAFGNTLSPHAFGRRARKATETAREELAALLNAKPQEIVFLSNASEANNTAIYSTAHALSHKGKHIIVSPIEHHSILGPAKHLGKYGYDVTLAPVNSEGLVDVKAIETLIRPDTILVAIAHANNEIGTIQPIEAIGKMLREKGIYFLVDAVQTVGHIPVDVKQLNADFLSLSAHKFYGSQGVGALFVRQGIIYEPIILGGDQERSRRAGTLNVPGIVGLGAAAKLSQGRMFQDAGREQKLRNHCIKRVLNEISGSILNGHTVNRLPNNAHFSFEGINGEELIASLDLAGFYCSMGSACTSGQLTPSHVLKAIGRSDAHALGSLRVSLGRSNTQEDIDLFVDVLKTNVLKLKKK